MCNSYTAGACYVAMPYVHSTRVRVFIRTTCNIVRALLILLVATFLLSLAAAHHSITVRVLVIYTHLYYLQPTDITFAVLHAQQSGVDASCLDAPIACAVMTSANAVSSEQIHDSERC